MEDPLNKGKSERNADPSRIYPPRDHGDTCNQATPQAGHPYSSPSLREQSEKQVGYHREQADRQDRAAAFFRENPAFDEFVQLVRSGVIQF